MADTDRNTTLLPAPNPFYRPSHFQGDTISELDKMVERALTTGPLMSVAQIRILLRVEQACEACDAQGCAACQGKGYREPPPPTAGEWDRFESNGAPDEYDREVELELELEQ